MTLANDPTCHVAAQYGAPIESAPWPQQNQLFFSNGDPMNQATINLVCPGCLSVNRVPPNRLTDSPVCGRCGQPLTPGKPIELNDRSFDKFLQRTGLPILVDFWAPWCGPCRMMAPAFAEAAAELSPRVLLAKLDTDAFPVPASRFGITGIPTIIRFQGGREVDRISGALDAGQIVQWAAAD